MSLVKVSDLIKPQRSVVESVPRGVKFVSGPAGTGKTTIGVRRMLRLLTKDKVFANEIFVLVPQRTLAEPYYRGIEEARAEPGGRITVGTLGSLSRAVVDLFFPLIADRFGNPNGRPTFLTLETAQYHMARVVGDLIDERAYFDTIAIPRSRLYSQLIDNLNKAALVGFPHHQLNERLIAAWGDKDRAQITVYHHAQECVNLFRDYCVSFNLIDFSLQVELFRELWEMPPVRSYLVNKYRHLIIDNIEEDTPITHDLLLDWVPEAESALILYDTQAGYRQFLGAAPASAQRLAALASPKRDTFTFTEADSFITSDTLRALSTQFAISFDQPNEHTEIVADPREALTWDQPRYYTQMIDHVAERVAALVHNNEVPANEIVILAPFLSDALRFALTERLTANDVQVRSHRPSRALREESAARTLLTWAQIAYPEWKTPPTSAQITHALMTTLNDVDLVRAQLISGSLYRNGTLHPFDDLASAVQERITYSVGERLQALYAWLRSHDDNPIDELDLFWRKLFGEVLSRQGFGYHNNFNAARIADNLITSAQKFRKVMDDHAIPLTHPLGQEYVNMVRGGVIGDLYLSGWIDQPEDAVLIAPAYTFLMMNRPVDYQFWLNVGSPGWWERLYQPLTHPHVLTRDWDWTISGQIWTDEDEYYTRNQTLYQIALGLTRRCRHGIYLGFSEFGEQGYEQRGALLGAIQSILRRLSQPDPTASEENTDV